MCFSAWKCVWAKRDIAHPIIPDKDTWPVHLVEWDSWAEMTFLSWPLQRWITIFRLSQQKSLSLLVLRYAGSQGRDISLNTNVPLQGVEMSLLNSWCIILLRQVALNLTKVKEVLECFRSISFFSLLYSHPFRKLRDGVFFNLVRKKLCCLCIVD